MSCQIYPVRSDLSLQYIRETLAEGNDLARSIVCLRDLDNGNVFSWLPYAPDINELADFSIGNASERSQSVERLIDLVASFLNTSSDHCCIFENRYAKRSDAYLQDVTSKISFLNEEVYHVLESLDCSRTAIRSAIIESDTSMQLIGMCTRMPKVPRMLSAQDVNALASSTEFLIVEAFDGGGFLIWTEKQIDIR